MKTTLTFMFVLLVLFVKSQQKISFTVLFPSDQHTLTPGSKRLIDSVLKRLVNTPKAYSVSIAGHTDRDGELLYNESLSTRRSETVKKYLMKKGFDKNLVVTDAYAYLQPVADNGQEDGKAKNRRVQISMHLLKPEVDLITGEKSLTMNYSVKPNQESFISYPSGTKIHIPANAFVHADGTPVSGSVTLQYTEYRNVRDFMASDIPMSFKNEAGEFVQFNSAGMFRIEASNNNKKLVLKPAKKIDVNFAMTGEVPDMQVFKFNERTKKWVVPPATDNTFDMSPKISFGRGTLDGCAGLYNGRDYCTLWPETAMRLAIRTGYKLATSRNPVYIKRARHYFVPSGYKMPSYRLQVTERKGKTIRFKLIPKGYVDPELDLSTFEWVYTTNDEFPFTRNHEEVLWLRVKLEYLTEKEFFMSLFRNDEELRLIVRGKLNNHYLRKNEMRSFYESGRFTTLKDILYKKSRSEDFVNVIPGSPERRLKNDACSDSLFCFYKWSKPWMSDSIESTLNFREWLDYFNLNKETMAERYTFLRAHTDSVIAGVMFKRAMQRGADMTYEVRALQQTEVSGLIRSVGVTELGIWNCDQLSRLKEPMMVEKTYRNTEGKKIEPTSLFVLDPAVNGVLVFNGSYDYSPYRFQVSAQAENTLIAFDNQNNIFLCRAADFASTLASNADEITLSPASRAQVQEFLKGWQR